LRLTRKTHKSTDPRLLLLLLLLHLDLLDLRLLSDCDGRGRCSTLSLVRRRSGDQLPADLNTSLRREETKVDASVLRRRRINKSREGLELELTKSFSLS